MTKRIILFLLVAGSCIGCDRMAKGVAVRQLQFQEAASLFGGVVRLEYAENKGAMLSIGAELSPDLRHWLLTIGVSGVLAALTVVVLLREGVRTREIVAASLVIGGGFGNVIDRILYNGSVIDFVNIGIGGLRTAVFNIADVAIVAGMLVFVFSRLREVLTSDRA